MFEEYITYIIDNSAPAIAGLFGNNTFISDAIINSPMLLPILLVVPALILLGVSLFVDFIKDSWKMPFGIALELMALYLYLNDSGWMMLLALVAAGVYFALSANQQVFKWVYSSAAFLKCFLMVPFLPIPEGFKAMLAFLPILTVLMFFLCITD